MKIRLTYLLTIIATILMLGCQNTVNTVENADKYSTPNYIVDARYVTDGFLHNRLLLRSVNLTTAPSGHMTVEVTATNVRVGGFAQFWSSLTGENPYSVDYKFTWQDANGMSVESALSIWQTKVIRPGETVFFKAIAPTLQCKDFILNLKESN